MNKQEIKEWVAEKQKLEPKYCGRCYTSKKVHRFGYCDVCWEKNK